MTTMKRRIPIKKPMLRGKQIYEAQLQEADLIEI